MLGTYHFSRDLFLILRTLRLFGVRLIVNCLLLGRFGVLVQQGRLRDVVFGVRRIF